MKNCSIFEIQQNDALSKKMIKIVTSPGVIFQWSIQNDEKVRIQFLIFDNFILSKSEVHIWSLR